ncbi:MAG: acyl-ACP--UDP-N-acetylglucosamine O-acyltransferase [Pseudomonadota bacterium]
MSVEIHPTAIIETGAEIGNNVSIGPYSVVGPDVKLGDGNRLGAHVVIEGNTTIGENNQFFSFTAIGGEPQSVSYKGEPTETRIGNNNTFRENITVNRGTMIDEGITSIGNDNLFMAYVHIAHDCRLGSDLLFSNNASLAGHVRVEDHVGLAGYTLVHQFCHIGAHSFCGVNTFCIQDIPPYMLVAGNKAITHGINIRGLRSRGFEKEEITELKRAYKIIYRSGHTMQRALEEIEAKTWNTPHVGSLIDFIRASKRGVIR